MIVGDLYVAPLVHGTFELFAQLLTGHGSCYVKSDPDMPALNDCYLGSLLPIKLKRIFINARIILPDTKHPSLALLTSTHP